MKVTMAIALILGLLAPSISFGEGPDELTLTCGRISAVLRIAPASAPGRWVLVCDRIDFPGGTLSLATSPLWSLDVRPVLPGPGRLAPSLKKDGDDLRYRLDGGLRCRFRARSSGSSGSATPPQISRGSTSPTPTAASSM